MSRLPTPETSCSNNDAFDADGRKTNSTFSYDHRQQSIAGGECGASGFPRPSASKWQPRYLSAPHSPPYLPADAPKPSLPPLKIVLGDSISSPPKTPSPRSLSQPYPREPAYTASVYKPPALYPNKKQRREQSYDPAPAYASAGSLRSPFGLARSLETREYDSTSRQSAAFPPINVPTDTIDTRHTSVQSVPISQMVPAHPWAAQYPGAQSVRPSNEYRPFEDQSSCYQTPQLTPSSSTFEPIFASFPDAARDPYSRDSHEGLRRYHSRPTSRRSSSSGYGVYLPQPISRERPVQVSYVTGTRYSMPPTHHRVDSRDSNHYGRPDQPLSRPGNGVESSPFQAAASSYFVDSHYEYQHGKTRKRSNLPKQSTEIMKTWFDQNIVNPYPSEEQKAVFSNATGISMTQVSNWFINHRRRCPELRDKREKGRAGSCDGDV